MTFRQKHHCFCCCHPPWSRDLWHSPSACLKQITQAVICSSSSYIRGIQPHHLFHTGVLGPFWVTFPACGDHGLIPTTTWFSAFSWLSRSLTDSTSKWFLSLCSPQSQKRQALLRALLCFPPIPLELPPLLTKQEQERNRPQLQFPFLTPPGIFGNSHSFESLGATLHSPLPHTLACTHRHTSKHSWGFIPALLADEKSSFMENPSETCTFCKMASTASK